MFEGVKIKGNIKLSVGSVTDTGLVREHNEDSIFADEENGVFVVADGMGGYEDGKFSSELAVSKVGDDICKPLDLLIHEIHAELKEKIEKGGTTFTGARILTEDDHAKMQISHVGDSRIYLIRNNTITQLTEDHNLLTEFIRDNRKSLEEAIKFFEEINKDPYMLYQALGPSYRGEIDVFSRQEELKPGDKILICSDGLTDMIKSDNYTDTHKIIKVIKKYKNPQEACKKLVELANEAGGKDNISAILIKVEKEKKYRNIKAISAALAVMILGAAAALYTHYKEEKPATPETTLKMPIGAAEEKAEEPQAAVKPPYTLSETADFRTRKIGPTSSILSRLENLEMIESTDSYDIMAFNVHVSGDAENAYAFFDNDMSKTAYKSEIKNRIARFVVKRPKNAGRLNVIAATGEDNAITWSASWKYIEIEEKIDGSEKIKGAKDDSYTPQKTIENIKKASKGYEIEKYGKTHQTWLWNDRIEVMETLANELSQRKLSNDDRNYIIGLADSIRNNEYLNEKMRKGRIKKKKVYSLVSRLESLVYVQAERAMSDPHNERKHDTAYEPKINPNYRFLARNLHHKQRCRM